MLATDFLRAHSANLGGHLGIEIVSAAKERVEGEMIAGSQHLTLGGRVHGGAIMAFADTIAAYGAVLNLPPGHGITTLESKTNFFAGGQPGRLRAEAVPLHVGRSTQVWQTTVTQADGARLALVLQTQMVLQPPTLAPAEPANEPNGEPIVTIVTDGARDAGSDTATRRREQIFHAACDVIARRGFEKATVREIATAAGMPVPTMYQYVRSKEDILALIYDSYMHRIMEDLRAATAGARTATEKLQVAIEANLACFDKFHKYIKLMHQETRSLSPAAKQRVLDLQLAYVGEWRRILDQGIRSGEFNPSNAEIASELIPLCCAVWPLRHWHVGEFGLDEVRRTILSLVLNGILKRTEDVR
jgi:1,4-dihydroxy-2-naphthoyl-CoA hydrolase